MKNDIVVLIQNQRQWDYIINNHISKSARLYDLEKKEKIYKSLNNTIEWCINITESCYSIKKWYEDHNYKIITFEEFIKSSSKMTDKFPEEGCCYTLIGLNIFEDYFKRNNYHNKALTPIKEAIGIAWRNDSYWFLKASVIGIKIFKYEDLYKIVSYKGKISDLPSSDSVQEQLLPVRKSLKDFTITDCILCKTKKEAEAICKLMHEAELKWISGHSYLERTNWSNASDKIHYYPKKGTFDYRTNGTYTVYEASLFLTKEPESSSVVLNKNHVGKYISFYYNNLFYDKGLIVKENDIIYILNNCRSNSNKHRIFKNKYKYSLRFDAWEYLNSCIKNIKILDNESSLASDIESKKVNSLDIPMSYINCIPDIIISKIDKIIKTDINIPNIDIPKKEFKNKVFENIITQPIKIHI